MNEDYINYMMRDFMNEVLVFDGKWQQQHIEVCIEVAGEVKEDNEYFEEWKVIKSKMEQVGSEAKYFK